MSKPQIATILEDGTYGQRDMTAQEIAEWEATTTSDNETPEAEQ
jgi:hypothetical protein